MKYAYIGTCLFLQILFVISCSSRYDLTVNYRGATCCEPSPILTYDCCCYDENLKPVIINYPTGMPPMNFIDTKGLNCDFCELGVLCISG